MEKIFEGEIHPKNTKKRSINDMATNIADFFIVGFF